VTRIEIVVDELVVRGLTPPEARAAAQALEASLATLAAHERAETSPRTEAFRRLGPITATGGADALGAAAAGSVWAALGGTGSDPYSPLRVVTNDPQGRGG